MTTLEKIKQEMAAFEEKKNALVEELRKDFPTILKPLFEAHPTFYSIKWHQYTPYFNDGDECTFSSMANYADAFDEEGEELDDMTSIEDFQEVLGEISDDFYRDLFGDHAEVTVYRDGTISVDEYDHD